MTRLLLPSSSRDRRLLFSVVALGFALRVGFHLFAAPLIWGADPAVHGDTPHYVNASMHLVDHGTLTADPTVPDATFSRVPLYSLAWAALYVVAGERGALSLMSWIQLLLDTLNILLVFATAARIAEGQAGVGERPPSPNRDAVGLLAALVYATLPFATFWVTPNVPDVMTTGLSLAVLLCLAHQRPANRWAIALGVLLGLAALTREYLVPLAGTAIVYAFWNRREDPRWAARLGLALAVAAVVYAPWPIRNLALHDRLVIQRSPSSGSRFYAADVFAARYWIGGFAASPQDLLEQIAEGDGPVDYPSWVFADDEERAFAERLTERARECGTAFNAIGHDETFTDDQACDDELVVGYARLQASFRRRHPFDYYLRTPAENLWKAFFKSQLVDGASNHGLRGLAIRGLFAYRTLLLVLGLAGFVVFRRNRRLLPALSFIAVIVLYMAGPLRGLQMRYLLQTDVWLFIPAAMLLVLGFERARRRLAPTAPEAVAPVDGASTASS